MMKQFTEGIEKVYAELDGSLDNNLELKTDIHTYVSEYYEEGIENGDWSQEELKGKVLEDLQTKEGEWFDQFRAKHSQHYNEYGEIDVELGGYIDRAIDDLFAQVGYEGVEGVEEARPFINWQDPAIKGQGQGLTDDFLIGRVHRVLSTMAKSPEHGGVDPDGESPLEDTFGTIRTLVSDIEKSHPNYASGDYS